MVRMPGRSWFLSLVVSLALLGAMSEPGRAAPDCFSFDCAIQPGVELQVEGVGSCTAGFVFHGSDRRSYVATAGHCAWSDAEPRESVWRGDGPRVFDSQGNEVGRFAFATYRRVGEHWIDFGLVQLGEQVHFRPEVMLLDGPRGVEDNIETPRPRVIRFVGQGLVVGIVAPARPALAVGFTDPDWVLAFGGASLGDSGAPVLTEDGLALGLITLIGIGADPWSTQAGTMAITRLPRPLVAAQERLGIELSLISAGT